jgi:hypothetical protein
MLLQAFYSIRSERQLMERLEFDLLFRWFVGIGIDDAAWVHSVFSKNRERLLEGDIAAKLLSAVLAQPSVKRLLSTDHFSVDGTLIEAWAKRAGWDRHADDFRALARDLARIALDYEPVWRAFIGPATALHARYWPLALDERWPGADEAGEHVGTMPGDEAEQILRAAGVYPGCFRVIGFVGAQSDRLWPVGARLHHVQRRDPFRVPVGWRQTGVDHASSTRNGEDGRRVAPNAGFGEELRNLSSRCQGRSSSGRTPRGRDNRSGTQLIARRARNIRIIVFI